MILFGAALCGKPECNGLHPQIHFTEMPGNLKTWVFTADFSVDTDEKAEAISHYLAKAVFGMEIEKIKDRNDCDA